LLIESLIEIKSRMVYLVLRTDNPAQKAERVTAARDLSAGSASFSSVN
jgi:hypothetical protein